MIQLFLILSITLPIVILYQIDPNQCLNFVNDTQMENNNYSCLDNQCIVTDGFAKILKNSSNTTSKTFQLCLNLSIYNLTIDCMGVNQPIVINSSLYINGITVSIINNSILQAAQSIVIEAQTQINIIQVTVRGTKLWFLSQIIIVDGATFINQSTLQTQCTCLSQIQNFSEQCIWNYSFPNLYQQQFDIYQLNNSQLFDYTMLPNNSITFIAFNSIEMVNTGINFSIIGIFATNAVFHKSVISTTGLGYPSGSGPGCGYFNYNLNNYIGCTGSGGSYGGFGGNSSPLDHCKLIFSQSPYGNISYPNDPGSGGGFILDKSYQSSSGGGITNIQVLNLTLSESYILSEGKNGRQGGGGGSGGSISIDFTNFFNGSTTKISANGGSGEKSSSSGSGGRIRFWDHNENPSQRIPDHQSDSFSITSKGGVNCQTQLGCGQSGSIITSPCPRWQQLNISNFFCINCSEGYYQLSTGYSFCLPCPQLPDNSQWTKNYSFTCEYTCKDGFQPLQGKCLTGAQHFFASNEVGNILLSICIILIALILFGVVKCMQFLLKHQKQHSTQSSQSGDTERKKIFRVHDLPYHQYRIYLMGENTPKNPWHINPQTQTNFDQQIKQQYTMAKIRNKIKLLFSSINQQSIYTRQQKILLFMLYVYPPCHRLMLDTLQRAKVKSIQNIVNQFNRQDNNLQQIFVKFHVKPHRTVASIQIFDYNKKQQDFDIEKCYPLYFMLQKTPFGGHLLDLADPFLRLLLTQISQKQGYLTQLQNFFKQLNMKLKKHQQTIACLNHLQKLNQLSTRLQAFLWQPPNKILGVNKNFQIDYNQPLFFIISSQNLNNNHFFYQKRLIQMYFNQVQVLKKAIQIKQNFGKEDHGSNFWMFQNDISQKILIWILGGFTVLLLILSVTPFILIILIQLPNYKQCAFQNQLQTTFALMNLAAFIFIAPFCNFVLCFFNFKTALQKNQYVLYNAMILTFLTTIKSFILFILTVPILFTSQSNNCTTIALFVQLASGINCIAIYISQILLRARIIGTAK